MALKIGTVEPTQIIVEITSDRQSVSFPGGRVEAKKISQIDPSGNTNYYYTASTSSHISFSSNSMKLENKLLTDLKTVIIRDENGASTYTYQAKYEHTALWLESIYKGKTTSSAPDTSTVLIPVKEVTALPCSDLTEVRVLKDGVTTTVWSKTTRLQAPVISDHNWQNENMTIRLTVTNPNAMWAVFHGTFYDTPFDDSYGSTSTSISPRGTTTVDIPLDSSFGEGVRCYIEAYFTQTRYEQSSTIKYMIEP